MRRPGQIAAGTFPFFTPLHFPLGFCAVAWAAEHLEVRVAVIVGAACVVDVVDFQALRAAALGALVTVAVEYAAPGRDGYMLGGVCPGHRSPVLCALFQS